MPIEPEIEAARAEYARTLPKRGAAAPLRKPDNRVVMALIAAELRNTTARVRFAVAQAQPALSALVSPAELVAMINAMWRHK